MTWNQLEPLKETVQYQVICGFFALPQDQSAHFARFGCLSPMDIAA